ncbi:MAG: hypothetical protein K0Q57_1005 [Gammaproteobacteria bacterium]|nr:hypothetical protein [Gammaproteobacteria bacterium]
MSPLATYYISQLQSVEGGFGGFNVVLQNPAWFIAHSRSVYVQYLISHPAYTLSMYVNPDFWQDILFAPSLLYGYACYGFPLTSIPSSLYILINYTNPISAMINAICPIGIVLLLISGLITYMEHFAKAQANLLIRFSELLIALTIIILASNVWLLEPMEDMRHQLNNHLLIVIGIILFSCKSLDYARLQSTNLVNR